MSRTLLAVAIAAVVALPTSAGAISSPETKTIDDDGKGIISLPEKPQPPTGGETCELTSERLICMEETEDTWGNGQVRVCAADEVMEQMFPGYPGGDIICVRTAEWSYVPGTGACVSTLGHDPLVCGNSRMDDEYVGGGEDGRDCVFWVIGLRLCGND